MIALITVLACGSKVERTKEMPPFVGEIPPEQTAALRAEADQLATSRGQPASGSGSTWKIPTSREITITIGPTELESIARRGMTVQQFAEATAEFVAPYRNPDLPKHPPGARDLIYAKHGDQLAQARLGSGQRADLPP
jgi:hypothetical protein